MALGEAINKALKFVFTFCGFAASILVDECFLRRECRYIYEKITKQILHLHDVKTNTCFFKIIITYYYTGLPLQTFIRLLGTTRRKMDLVL